MRNNINLKIYWVTTVGQKWQIIIPKESRDDLKIEVWNELDLILIDKKVFAVWQKWESDDLLELKQHFQKIEEVWSIIIWTKYQFVIPNSVRKELNIKSWDNLIVVGKESWVGFIKNDNIDFLFEFIKEYMLLLPL